MKCQICGKENEPTNAFCTNCGSSLNQEQNKKALKIINILRVVSSIIYIVFLAICIYAYLDAINSSDTTVAGAILIGPVILIAVIYLSIIIFLNLVYFRKNIISNIRTASMMEAIPCGLFLLTQFQTLMFLQGFYWTYFLMFVIPLIVLIFPILKLVLLKKLPNISIDERVMKNNKKYIVGFIISCFCISIILFFASVFVANDACNRHYELNDKQLKQELKSYTYISEQIVEDYPTGFECRDEDLETYISFKDKYNNDVRLTISDHHKGKVYKNGAMKVVADVQFVNNILKNEKINIVYNEEKKEYEFLINDPILSQYFDVRVFLSYKEQDNIHVYEFDLKNINYKVRITLDQKYKISVDKDYVMPYIESFVHNVYAIVGQEKISKFELWLNDDPDLEISSYNQNNIIWKEKE